MEQLDVSETVIMKFERGEESIRRREAMRAGRKTFASTRPCSKHGMGSRRIDGSCTQCARIAELSEVPVSHHRARR